MTAEPAGADDHTPTWLTRHPVWTTLLALAAIATPVSVLLELPSKVVSAVSAFSGTDTEPAITGTWPLARGFLAEP
ncbi:hypothetical protein [Modestobacter sp. I12A-02662]|uniref:hypothetical protein n=1 Tax=Modestobacter sp. I12A-02662 TaxID=1730496 RepID=UPI0034DF7AF2